MRRRLVKGAAGYLGCKLERQQKQLPQCTAQYSTIAPPCVQTRACCGKIFLNGWFVHGLGRSAPAHHAKDAMTFDEGWMLFGRLIGAPRMPAKKKMSQVKMTVECCGLSLGC